MIMLITCNSIITIKIFTTIRQKVWNIFFMAPRFGYFWLKCRTFHKECSKVNVWQNKAKWHFYPTVSKIHHHKDGINPLIKSKILFKYNDMAFMKALTSV